MDDVQAVVFDMDGVLLDSGAIWEGIIARLFEECGAGCDPIDPESFAGGDNSLQWASYLRTRVGLPLLEEEIIDKVVTALLAAYEDGVPLLPGAEEALARLAARYPLALASSSPRPVIAFALDRSGLGKYLTTWVSSDDVPRGKPAPDVYLKACEQLAVDPAGCVAVEDSRFGIQAAKTAGMKVIAIPQPFLPVDPASLALADAVLASLEKLTPDAVRAVLNGTF